MTRHLLHIGYPKAGSTFLQRWFEAHPQLAYTEGGIAGFRDVYAIDRDGAQQRDAPLYRVTSSEALSAPRPDSGQALVDYASTRELSVADAQRQVCSTLAALFPNATVLIVTRGFRSMLLSSYSQYARSGGDVDLHEIVRAFAIEPDPRQLESWDYDYLIGEYRQAFGDEHVIVMPYELLRDDMDAFIRTLADRLGIEPMPAVRERINESLSPDELYWYPRLTRLMRRIPSRRLRERYIHAALRNDLRRPIAWLNRLRPGTPFTAASIPNELVEAFRGRAELLRGDALYAPYAGEYLHG
jgi:hypothetical protein